MLLTAWTVVKDTWRGLWTPQNTLNPTRRWWHYVEYWTERTRDVTVAILVLVFPPAIGFLAYEFNAHISLRTVALVVPGGLLWLLVLLLAHHAGRRSRIRAKVLAAGPEVEADRAAGASATQR